MVIENTFGENKKITVTKRIELWNSFYEKKNKNKEDKKKENTQIVVFPITNKLDSVIEVKNDNTKKIIKGKTEKKYQIVIYTKKKASCFETFLSFFNIFK